MTDQTLTHEELEDAADAARLESENLEAQMTAAREQFAALLLSGDVVDSLAYSRRQNESAMLLVQLKLKAARAQLALVEHEAKITAAERGEAYVEVRTAEGAVRDAERTLLEARTRLSRASSADTNYHHKRQQLTEEIKRLAGALLSAVDGQVSALRPPPTVIRG